jgi:hypothetical protein
MGLVSKPGGRERKEERGKRKEERGERKEERGKRREEIGSTKKTCHPEFTLR